MLQQGHGRIINTASMASLLVPHPQKQIAYNASKAAVVKITETLGAEWADRGITVNCMSPGIVNTALIQVRRHAFPEQWHIKEVHLQRWSSTLQSSDSAITHRIMRIRVSAFHNIGISPNKPTKV